ncbi:MAG: hypothetical protein JO022_11245 [Acidobacteriaceae bacterium]|nr:hypothetical protein [Acidobacteriaceae bacterium]
MRSDAALLAEINQHNEAQVNLTITTLDEGLARLVEPMAPRPLLRVAAVRALANAGVRVMVLAHPVMPLINDAEESLDAIAAVAKQNGASSFSAAPLFLKPCSAQVFLPFLEEKFPHLAGRYRERYRDRAYLKGFYPDLIQERVQRIVARHGLQPRERAKGPEYWNPQIPLF